MVSIAVIGPGAVGGTVAAWLAQNADYQVTVCARTAFAELVVETPDGVISASPMVLTDPGKAPPVDWVLIATKAYDVASVQPWLIGLVGPQTRVAVLQNGVEQVARFAPVLPMQIIVPVVVDVPAIRTAPGRITQHRYGMLIVPAGPNGQAFVELFGHTPIAARATEEFVSRAWLKLAYNCAGAASALTLRSTGPVWSDGLAEIIGGLVGECVAVARAEGADLGPDVVDVVVENARTMPAGAINSMHADRLAGRPMEFDARNGVIVRLGFGHGIATPMNAMVVALLAAC
ncbi:2-dehydropantoate 2-reductase [Devosia sp.]|uniref:2-dehydropantoate 2-reductase n=1 Tax=Devosia sp. TaxID=1871048 RepID=UPI003265E81A